MVLQRHNQTPVRLSSVGFSYKRYLLTAGPPPRPAAPPTSVCVTPARLHSPGTYTHQVQVEKDASSQGAQDPAAQLTAGLGQADQVSDTRCVKRYSPEFPLIRQGKGDGRRAAVAPPKVRTSLQCCALTRASAE